MSRNKLYTFLLIGCIAGILWILFNEYYSDSTNITSCAFKNATGIPCPSCGSTRSAMSIFHGELFNAFMLNPFGFIIASALVIIPGWVIKDIIFKKSTLHNFYNRIENFIKRKYVYIPLIIITLANWIWNIIKGI